MERPFDTNSELTVWGPVSGKAFYAYWIKSNFYDFPKLYGGLSWPTALELIRGERFAVILDQQELTNTGGKVFLQEMLPLDRREAIRTECERALAVLKLVEGEIDVVALPALSDDAFLALWNRFLDSVDAFWVHTVVPELSNYGSTEVLRRAIAPHVPEAELPAVLEALTAPEELSFYQIEEIELLETDEIKEHASKYVWLKNGYDLVQALTERFFAERKDKLAPSMRQEHEVRLERVRGRKEEVRARYGFSDDVADISRAIVEGIVWQDMRKREVLIILHYMDMMLNEIARRFNFAKGGLLNLLPQEINDLISGKELSVGLREREDAFGFMLKAGDVSVLNAEAARAHWDAYLGSEMRTDVSELKGAVACRGSGPMRGRVRVVLDPRIETDFERDEILVTTMTTPEYIFIMKKAAAIVTDNGGLTSHAAIVSRELNVPCIVGTKIATRVLKNGDMIEVDANAGIVRKI